MPVRKPERDERIYRLLQIHNIPVLVVSDTKAAFSGAAISVGAGSGDSKVCGIAHYLEHDVFIGTEEYPLDFQKYIASQMGMANAMTECEKTVYLCTYNKEREVESLKRLLSMLKCPSLKGQYVEKELNAVDAEFQMDKSIPGWRDQLVLEEIVRSHCGRDHPVPFSIFGCGNRESLKNIKSQQLIDFWAQNYKKRPVYSVVFTDKSAEDLPPFLQQLQTPFEQLGNVLQPVAQTDRTSLQNPFRQYLRGKFVSIASIEKDHKLSLMFPLDALQFRPELGDMAPLTILLADPRNLPLRLRESDLASDVDAGVAMNYSFGSVYQVEFLLTENGRRNILRVIALFFGFVRKLFAHYKEGDNARGYVNYVARLMELRFQYKPKKEPFEELEELVHAMDRNFGHLDNVLMNTLGMDSTKALAAFRDLENFICAENCFAVYNSPSVTKTDQTEKWFGAKYSVAKLRANRMEYAEKLSFYKDVLPTEKDELFSRNFLSSTLSNNIKITVKSEPKFKLPFARMYAKVGVGLEGFPWGLNGEDLLAASVACELIAEDARREYADHLLAFGDIRLGINREGFEVFCKAFTSSMEQRMLGRTLDLMDAFIGMELTRDESLEERFERKKKRMVSDLENSLLERPFKQTLQDFACLVEKKAMGTKEKISILKTLKYDAIQKLSQKLKGQKYCFNILFHGNISDELSKKIGELYGRYQCKAIPTRKAFHVKSMAAESHCFFEEDCELETEQNSACFVALPFGVRHFVADTLLQLLSSQLKQPFFDQLRSKENLGYVATSTLLFAHGLAFIGGVVQSPSFDAHHLSNRIRAFLFEFISGYSGRFGKEDVTLRIKQMIHELEIDFQSSEESFQFYQGEIESERYMFDYREKKKALLEVLLNRGGEWLEALAQSLKDKPFWSFMRKPKSEEEIRTRLEGEKQRRRVLDRGELLNEGIVWGDEKEFLVREYDDCAELFRGYQEVPPAA